MSKPKPIYLTAASIPLLAIAVFAAAGVFRTALLKVTQSPTAVVTNNVSEPLQNIRFTVYDVGIYPQEMQVNASRLGIVFDDRTGRSTGFVVQRLAGNAFEVVGQINAVPNRPRTRGEVRLTPGRYRVFDSARPEISSTLIVNQ